MLGKIEGRRRKEQQRMRCLDGIVNSVLSLLYGPTLTSAHDYCKNHSFDYMDFVENDVSAF